jgi:hypothetical protein
LGQIDMNHRLLHGNRRHDQLTCIIVLINETWILMDKRLYELDMSLMIKEVVDLDQVLIGY